MVKCSNFRSFQSGSLLGFADIEMQTEYGTVTIRGCKLFQKDGKRWIKIPSSEFEKDGEKKYSPFLRFESREEMERFTIESKNMIDEHCAQRSVFNDE